MQTAIDNLIDGLAILKSIRNENGKITDFIFEYINKSGAETLNSTQDKIVNKTVKSLLPNFDKTILFKTYSEVTETGIPKRLENIEYRDERNGELVLDGIFSVSVTKFEDGVVISWHDTSEEVRITKELKETREQFKNAIMEAPYPLIIHASDGEVLHVNKAWTDITRYPIEDIPTMRDWVRLAYDEDITEDIYQKIATNYDLKERKHFGEFTINTKDQRKLIFDFSVAPIGTLNDGRRMVMSMAVDVTEKKQNDEKIIYQANLLDNANDAIFGLSPEFRVLYWNRGAEVTYGFTADEMLGNIFYEKIISSSNSETIKKRILKLEKEHNLEVETQQYRKDGKLIDIYSKTRALFDVNGNVSGYVTINSDISERKKIERALSKSEERFKLSLFNSNITLFQMDENLRYVWIYNSFPQISEIDIQGKTDYDIFPEKTASILSEYKKKAIKTKSKIKFEEKITRNYSKYYYDFIIEPIFNEYNDVKGIKGIAVNVTERKELELKLFTTMKDLERSNHDLEQFAYVASHDLQEPVRTILSYAKLLKRKLGSNLDQDSKDFLEFILSGSTRMYHLIRDLLQFSKVSSKQADFQKVNLHDVINNVKKLLSHTITERDAEINYENLPEIYGDQIQLEQLFQNLISNSIKFTDGKPIITINSHIENGNYVITVKDNGIGISSEYKDKIFVIFQRLHTQKEYTGTGIGLAISKTIVDKHGGKIWVESELGKGSTFYISIPKIEL